MRFKHTELDLSTPRVMGILNVTPDSFSDGGKFIRPDSAMRQVEQMVLDGADFIDVGGESTRPGAAEVALSEELDRVVPVIEAITRRFDTLVSVDTSKAQVMTESVNAGASLINDVRALREEGALLAAANAKVPVCLMHMQGQPRTMQEAPEYRQVTEDVRDFMLERLDACKGAGICSEQIILDPGFGFGKTLEHNYTLLNELDSLLALGMPLLVGISRKSMIGKLLNRDVDERLAGSLAAATIAAMKGAQIIRVHDVKETADALNVVAALHPQKEK